MKTPRSSFFLPVVLAGTAICLSAEAVTPNVDAGSLLKQNDQQNKAPTPSQTFKALKPKPMVKASPEEVTVLVREFKFSGNTLLSSEDLSEVISAFVDRSLTMAQIKEVADVVMNTYREAGWIVRAYLPQQEIASGVVNIQVVEAVFGGASLSGKQPQRLPPSVLIDMAEANLGKGTHLHAGQLDRTLLLLDDLPGVNVAGNLVQGQKDGEINLNIAANGSTTGSIASSSAISIASGATLAYNLSSYTDYAAGPPVVNQTRPLNTISGTGTIANSYTAGLTGTNVILDLSGTDLSGFSGTYSTYFNEATATPARASIKLGASPNLTGTTFNVVTSGYKAAFASLTGITWTGAASLSALASYAGGITGSGNVKVQSRGSLTIDRDITLSGAASRIDLLAGSNTARGVTTGGDITLSNTITTTDTGTFNIFTATPNFYAGGTSTLMSKMVGATGVLKYKTYNTAPLIMPSAVLGTRNFNYRQTEALVTSAATLTKTYDGTSSTVGAALTGGVVTGAIDGDSFTTSITGGTYASPNAGSNIVLTGTTASIAATSGTGWSLSGFTTSLGSITGVINKASLTVTPTVGLSKTYGAVDPSLTYTTSALQNSESSIAGLSGLLTRAAGENAGNYIYSVSGLSSTNYTFTMVASPSQFTINKANLTVTPTVGLLKTYGAIDPSLTYTTSALLNSDTSIAGLSGTMTRATGENVGNYVYSLSGLSSSNYTFTMVGGPSQFVISARPITVAADAMTKVYGNADPSFTYSLTSGSLVNGDVLSGALSRASGETVGSYAIGQGTLAASSNYALAYAAANLVIDPRPVTLTGRMNYSGQPTIDTTQTGTILTATNLVQGDSLMVSGTATLASAAAGTRAITAFNGLTLSNSNYTTSGASGNVTLIPTGGINVVPLSNNEVAALIGSQLAGLSGSQIASFSTTQLQVFSWQQIAALSPSQFAALSAAQLASLSATQLQGLSAAQISLMTPAQLSGLSPSQFAGLSNAQLQAMTSTQVGAISTAQLSSLSDAQLNTLSLEQLAAISPVTLAALSPSQIMALSLTQVVSLTPDQLSNLSPTQIASFSAEEVASFNAQQLAAIGIFPKVEAPDALPLATVTTTTTTTATATATAKFEAPIPVMTEVATPSVPSVELAAVAPATPLAPSVSAVQAGSATPPVATAASDVGAGTGVLAITLLSGSDARPSTTGVAFEQDANGVSLRLTSAPSVPPVSAKFDFNDKLTTFLVAQANGQMVEFQGGLINKRLVIVAPSAAAKQIARTEMNIVLAAAITSLGAENRVVLANLDGVVIDLR